MHERGDDMKRKIYILLAVMFLVGSGISEVVAMKQHGNRNVPDARIINRESEQTSDNKKIKVMQKVTEQISDTKEFINLNPENVQDIVTTDITGTESDTNVINQNEIQESVTNSIGNNVPATTRQTGKDESAISQKTSEKKQDSIKAVETEGKVTTESKVEEKTTESKVEEKTESKDLYTGTVKTDIEETTTNRETVSEKTEEWFRGVLIDQDCSDFENPPEHDLPCMLMYSCRDSGYGIDVEEDGSWKFYPFDENGNTLAWSYLNKTTRLYGLWVDVKGKIENGIIHVSLLKEG